MEMFDGIVAMGSDITPQRPTEDIEVVLSELRDALLDAVGAMEDDTDHPAYCVVPNETVSTIVERFAALDLLIQEHGVMPKAWQRTEVAPRGWDRIES